MCWTIIYTWRLQGEEDTVISDITRALTKSLPLLFTKHQTDEARIAVVLSIPLLMNLDLYLEMRMTAVSRVTSFSSSLKLTFDSGLCQPVGRHHKAIHFSLVASRSLACRGGDPPPYGCDKSVQHK